ncbi:MAG: sigma-E processing peptidase SpoIIGA [Firmicutes bacterium]|jgi:stage II sporulation protein GA (sporulation sigma-E factor processing peptidase)|nr:sigma-E processing peptidase SpoIIGA [Bacillota bacterium]HPU01348.1 sigma-E processing peptidase SpoIIGA [Bacillota bacterium]
MYLDLLFLLNLVVHYFLLLFTARLFHRQAACGRLLGGAALGAMAVLMVPLQLPPWFNAAVILAAPLLMIFIAFWPLRPLETLSFWGAFFLASFTLAGALTALLSLDLPRRLFRFTGGLLLVAGVCLALYLLFGLLRPILEDKKWQKLWQAELLVAWRGKEKAVPAFLDTGNRLRDPFTGSPVIIVDYRSLEGLLPPQVYRCLADEAAEPWSALEQLPDPALVRSFTLIPCRGLSRRGELLLGFRPDAVAFLEDGRSRPLGVQVYLGLTRQGFGPAAEYRALLPPELLRTG